MVNCNASQNSATPHIGIGIFYILHGSIYMVTTIPCLLVIVQKDMRRHSGYKIMLAMGFLDICNLITSCFISGIYSLNGTTYCNHQTGMTIVGRITLAFWCAYSLCCMLLAFNRWLDIRSQKMFIILFGDDRTWYWLFFPALYGGYFASPLTNCFIYDIDLDVWVVDLSSPGSDQARHENLSHTINNIVVVIVLIGFYLLISIEIRRRCSSSNQYSGEGNCQDISASQKQVVIQSALICLMTMVATLSYIVIQFVVLPNWLTKFPQISWQATHGCNGIIYLVFSKKIRSRVMKMIACKKCNIGNQVTTVTNPQHHSHSQCSTNVPVLALE